MTDETPEPDLPAREDDPAWMRRVPMIVSISALTIIAFALGQCSAVTSTTRAPAPSADPCAAILATYEKVDDGLGGDPVREARASMHYIIDHAECFAPDLVAQAKALLDEANSLNRQPVAPVQTFGAPPRP